MVKVEVVFILRTKSVTLSNVDQHSGRPPKEISTFSLLPFTQSRQLPSPKPDPETPRD